MKIEGIIEIPKGSNIKYEFNKEKGVIFVDRILKLAYPFNYGFIPNTLWDDGDPLDLIVVGNFNLHPLTHVTVDPIAVVEMFDNGESDFKVIGKINDIDLEYFVPIIKSFLNYYKEGVEIKKIETNPERIKDTIARAALMYQEN